MSIITLVEHSRFEPNNDDEVRYAVYGYIKSRLSRGSLEESLIPSELATFHECEILKVVSEDTPHHLDKWFALKSNNAGRLELRTQGWVGAFSLLLSNGQSVTIEILPKVFKQRVEDYRKRNIGLLSKMLIKTAFDNPKNTLQTASLNIVDNLSLLDIFIREFVDSVKSVISKGLNQGYVETEDNLRYIKGRLDVVENMRHNVFNRSKFYCQFDEFCEDIPENRLILSSLQQAVIMATDRELKRDLQRCLFHFDSVSPSYNAAKDFSDTLMKHLSPDYQAALSWCELILMRKGYDISGGGKGNVPSLMFDMAALFESYIGVILKRRSKRGGFSTSGVTHYLASSIDEAANKFEQKPDYIFHDENEMAERYSLVGDAKWKTLDESSDTLTIAESDIRQIYTYIQLFQPTSNIGLLIYPAIEGGDFEVSKGFKLNGQPQGNGEQFVWVLAYDLQIDEFVFNKIDNEPHHSLQKLSEIIDIELRN